MTHSKSFHKLVQQRQVEIVKASEPARRLIGKIFKTNVDQIQKSYQNPVFVFANDTHIYKVFYRDIMFHGLHFKNDQHMVNMYVKFFQNYQGDMQLSDYYVDDNCSILQIKKLPGIKLTDIKEPIDITTEVAGEWFAEQCKQIHLAGMRCVEKHKEFEIQRNIFKSGYYFVFSDWNKDNILYDYNTSKLYLVDLQPINWIPSDLLNGVIRSQWKEINSFNWKRPISITGTAESNLLSKIIEGYGKQYFPKKANE